MRKSRSFLSLAIVVAAAGGVAVAAPTAALADSHSGYHGHSSHSSRVHQSSHHGRTHSGANRAPDLKQVNLVSDIPGMAKLTDPALVNPWGMSLRPDGSSVWTSNQGSDGAELFSLPPHTDKVAKSATRLNMAGSVPGPSGQVANPGNGFVLKNGSTHAPAHFIFSTLDGNIEAWSPDVDPAVGSTELKATVPGASYTGLALATSRRNGDQLYAANFAQGRIDVFDSTFKQVKTASWQFSDPHLPKGYLPFNAQAVNGNIYVTYDTVDPATGRGATTAHTGVVDEYDADGHFLDRVLTGGDLNAPWGVAVAPSSWGSLAGSLLVGNFGDGRINIVAKDGNHFAHRISSQLRTSNGRIFSEPGLWGLQPGNAKTGGTDALFFTAGINKETNGLFGLLRK